MPRGKNYVNQNKGMRLQGPGGVQQECKYGSACTRKDCIYRHSAASQSQSNDPCMAYLAGMCSFTGKTCNKKHPNNAECERLLQKYSSRPCRFGEQCRTTGCLYNHEAKPSPAAPRLGSNAPALSSWMPTNTLPSSSNLRPSAGSWQPNYAVPPYPTRSFQPSMTRNPPPNMVTRNPPSYPVQAPPIQYSGVPNANSQPFVPYAASSLVPHSATWEPLNQAQRQTPRAEGADDKL